MKAWLRRPWIIIGTAATLLLTVGGVWVLFGSSAFAVSQVKVEGATFADVNEVRTAAEVGEGVALATVDTDVVATKVAEVPSVAEVSVAREWPHTIVVNITERSPVLALAKDDRFTLVDESGVAFRTVSSQPKGTVLAKLKKPRPKDAATVGVLKVVESLTPELRKVLVKVDGSAVSRITLELKDSRTVFFGDSSEAERKSEVATALLGRNGEQFDVSAPGVPTVS